MSFAPTVSAMSTPTVINAIAQDPLMLGPPPVDLKFSTSPLRMAEVALGTPRIVCVPQGSSYRQPDRRGAPPYNANGFGSQTDADTFGRPLFTRTCRFTAFIWADGGFDATPDQHYAAAESLLNNFMVAAWHVTGDFMPDQDTIQHSELVGGTQGQLGYLFQLDFTLEVPVVEPAELPIVVVAGGAQVAGTSAYFPGVPTPSNGNYNPSPPINVGG